MYIYRKSSKAISHIFACIFVLSRICLGDIRKETLCFEGGSPSSGWAGVFRGERMRDLCSGHEAGWINFPWDGFPNTGRGVESGRFPLMMIHYGDGRHSNAALEKIEPEVGWWRRTAAGRFGNQRLCWDKHLYGDDKRWLDSGNIQGRATRICWWSQG